jgi:TRAP-type C4-dicarboxylate transport system substrate-binding protein
MGKHRTVARAAAGVALLLVVPSAACGSGETTKAGRTTSAPVELTLVGNNHESPPQVTSFADEVKRLSNGQILIAFQDGWREGEPSQEAGTIDDVEKGVIEMAWVGARAFDTIGETSFQALLAPLLVDSYALEERVFDFGIPVRMLKHVNTKELVPLAVLPGPMPKLMGTEHPFVTQADFAGAVIGHSAGALTERTLRALGATPKLVPARPSLDGLDGLVHPLIAIDGYAEQAKFVTANLNFFPRPLVIIMNPDAFAALTPEQQAILRTASANAIAPALAAARADDAAAGPNICRRPGMTTIVEASPTDLANLRAALDPVYADLELEPETKAYLDEIRALKEQTASPAETITCPGSRGGQATDTSQLDGVYRWSVTLDELVAGGEPPIVDNAGDWRLVFKAGRFATTTENKDACGWGYGTFAVTGDRLEMTFIDGGGGEARNRPGELYSFAWSLYRDTLTLGVAGEFSPLALTLRPLPRISTTPSVASLSSRCPPPANALG